MKMFMVLFVMQPTKEFGGIKPTLGKKDNSYIGYLYAATNYYPETDPKKMDSQKPSRMDAALIYVGENTEETRNNILNHFDMNLATILDKPSSR